MDYVHPNGNNPIAKWCADLSVQERADIDALFSILENMRQWQEPEYKVLKGDGKGLSEIRWKGYQGRPLRLLGFTEPAKTQFIILLGCTKNGKKYDPSSAFETALKRKSDLQQGRGTICEH